MNAAVGPGTDTVQISTKDGMVLMHFEKPVLWVALDPSTGARFAESFARACYETVHGDVPTTEKHSQITEMMRVRLTRRVELMLGSFDKDAPRPDYKVQATRIVDEVLKEAT